jgi:putative periplasmic protein
LKKNSNKKVGRNNSKKGYKKPFNKRQNSSNNHPFLGLFTLLIVCFCAGLFTYKGLDFLFKDQITKQDELKDLANLEIKQKNSNKDLNFTEIKIKKSDEVKKIKSKQALTLKEQNSSLDKSLNLKNQKNLQDKQSLENKNLKENTYYFTHNYTQIGDIKDKIPKLVIIIDDVASYEHINEIKKINLKLTPSIMPPSKDFPNTPKIAKNLEFYMIHLPLEALDYNSNSIKTLKISDSYDEISKEIYKIRQNFPNAKFINNHTGSKFTSNLNAVKRLSDAMDKYGFILVDSKTIADSKIKEVLKSKHQKYIFRDVFLDNTQNPNDIKNELKKAVQIAKERGFAIAIAHPKKQTLKVLKNSGEILKDVEVVYLRDIYEKY